MAVDAVVCASFSAAMALAWVGVGLGGGLGPAPSLDGHTAMNNYATDLVSVDDDVCAIATPYDGC